MQWRKRVFWTNTAAALVENADLFRTYHGYDNDRIKVLLGPHAPYTCPDAYMEKVIALSHELNCGIHMHLSETKGKWKML